MYRGGGSIGIIGAARSGLLVAKDPDNPEQRVLASIKSNLGPPAPALAFHIQGTQEGAIRVAWDGESQHTPASLLVNPLDGESRDATEEAVGFLRDCLASEAIPGDEVKRQGRAAGISERTLERAKSLAGVKARKTGFGKTGKWVWELVPPPSPPKTATPALRMPSPEDGDLSTSLAALGRPGENDPPIQENAGGVA